MKGQKKGSEPTTPSSTECPMGNAAFDHGSCERALISLCLDPWILKRLYYVLLFFFLLHEFFFFAENFFDIKRHQGVCRKFISLQS